MLDCPLTAVTLHLTLAMLVKYHSVSTDLAVSLAVVLAPNASPVLAPLPPTGRAEKGRAPYDALGEERRRLHGVQPLRFAIRWSEENHRCVLIR